MDQPDPQTITQLLLDWSKGERQALERLIPVVYTELHRIAERSLRREGEGHTLQPTALVNEAFLKLFDQTRVEWQNRLHFFGVAANLMRRILIDHARKHHANKRGGGAKKISIDSLLNLSKEMVTDGRFDWSDEKYVELLTINNALEQLEKLDPQKHSIVALKYFFGFTVEETAAALDVAVATVVRQWRTAKTFLYHEITKEALNGSITLEKD